mmetsp:Transcript_76040/g.150662  ORF Transcript_76040/g.150662 Transcript_76040/m.150662 type:complete len:223 (-) Transcript_76040:182-850(-)
MATGRIIFEAGRTTSRLSLWSTCTNSAGVPTVTSIASSMTLSLRIQTRSLIWTRICPTTPSMSCPSIPLTRLGSGARHGAATAQSSKPRRSTCATTPSPRSRNSTKPPASLATGGSGTMSNPARLRGTRTLRTRPAAARRAAARVVVRKPPRGEMSSDNESLGRVLAPSPSTQLPAQQARPAYCPCPSITPPAAVGVRLGSCFDAQEHGQRERRWGAKCCGA